jgi:hypothetical protein
VTQPENERNLSQFRYIEDQSAITKFKNCVETNLEAYQNDYSLRSAHPFPILATASGISFIL